MRITARIVSSGKWWTFHLPTPKIDEIFPLREDGRRNANMDAVRIALNHPDYITHGKKDTPYLQCMAAQLLVKMGEWKETKAIGHDNRDYDRAVARLERKEERACEAEDAAEVLTYARAEFTVRYDADGKQIVRFGCTTRKEDGNAMVSGDARVSGNADYMVFKNSWSSGRWFTYTRSNKKWRVGCFYGTGEELIRKAYVDSEVSGKCYEAIVRAQDAIDRAMEKEDK